MNKFVPYTNIDVLLGVQVLEYVNILNNNVLDV